MARKRKPARPTHEEILDSLEAQMECLRNMAASVQYEIWKAAVLDLPKRLGNDLIAALERFDRAELIFEHSANWIQFMRKHPNLGKRKTKR